MCAYVYILCVYIYIYLHISEMNDSNDTKEEELGLFYYKVLTLLVNGIVLSEYGLVLAVNVYCKLQGNH